LDFPFLETWKVGGLEGKLGKLGLKIPRISPSQEWHFFLKRPMSGTLESFAKNLSSELFNSSYPSGNFGSEPSTIESPGYQTTSHGTTASVFVQPPFIRQANSSSHPKVSSGKVDNFDM